jgi:hypothetical protein
MTVGVNVTAGSGGSGSIDLENSGGLATVNNGATFSTQFLTVNSPGGILFDTTTVIVGMGGHANFTTANVAGDVATVQNTSFLGMGNVNISAHTIVLNNVNFTAGSQISLLCNSGLLAPNGNTGQAMVAGDVNFINNVNYAGNNALNVVGTSITIGKAP